MNDTQNKVILSDKLLEVIQNPPDSALSIVTTGKDGGHIVNSWNSYITLVDDYIILPAGRMNKTEENLKENDQVEMTICNREVQGRNYKGTGFLIRGKGFMQTQGPYLDKITKTYPWARAALVVKIESYEQTL